MGGEEAQTTVDAEGRYGYDPVFKVSGTNGAEVTLQVGGVLAAETATWESGKVEELNLTIDEEPAPPVPRYALTMAAVPEAGGNATDETGTSPYLEGAQVAIKAQAQEGYRFVNWTSAPVGIIDDEDAPETFLTMPGVDVTVTANFDEIPINDLTVTSEAGGSVTATIDEEETLIEAGQPETISGVAEGTEVDLVAAPADGYRFIEWGATAGQFDDAENAQATFIMPAEAAAITAIFAEAYELTMAVDPVGGGTAIDVTGDSPYAEGTAVDIRAEAEGGYGFVNWTSDPDGIIDDEEDAETFLTMPAQDVIVTANFQLQPSVPTVITGPATDITIRTAVLSMTYTTGNYSSVDVRFSVKRATDVTWFNETWVSRTEDGTYSYGLTELQASTEYEFKAQLRYDSTVLEDEIRRFTTPSQTTMIFPPFCFIATAAYGTPSAEQIDVLREFRDVVLLESAAGSRFVALYYRLSPPVADVIAASGFLRTLVRELLVDPVVWIVDATGDVWRN